MGRFVLSNKDRPLDFKAQLFGSEPEDMLLRITASRKHDKAKQQKIDTPEEPVHSFYLR